MGHPDDHWLQPGVQLPDDTPAEPGWAKLSTLALVLAVGWTVWKLTEQPGLAALVLCLKFGWSDFRTAFWLRRADPDRGRGGACFWLYFSSGLWKTAVIGVAMVLVVIGAAVVEQALRQNGPRQDQRLARQMLASAAVTAFFAFSLTTLTTSRCLWLARRHGVRLWLNGAVGHARARRDWPPLYGRRNWTLLLLLTAVLVFYFVLMPLLGGLFLRPLMMAGAKGAQVAAVVVVVWMFAAPALLANVLRTARRDHVAAYPEDCWGLDPAHATEAEPQTAR
jgi:hypothetical protein